MLQERDTATSTMIKQLQQQARNVKELMTKHTSSSGKLVMKGDYVFLISSKWMHAWMRMTGFNVLMRKGSISDCDMDLSVILSPTINEELIDNSKSKQLLKLGQLVEDLSFLDVVLKDGIEGGQDGEEDEEQFEVMPEEVWRFIKQEYPNAVEIKRPVFTSASGHKKHMLHLPEVVVMLTLKDHPSVLR